jgi:hypothetical protein
MIEMACRIHENDHGGVDLITYCTQNDGDCEMCSLSNYGRDCKNNEIEEEEGEE